MLNISNDPDTLLTRDQLAVALTASNYPIADRRQLRDAFAIAARYRRALWLARRYRLAPNITAGVASSAFSGRGRA